MSSISNLDKARVSSRLCAQVAAELEVMTLAQKRTIEAATHEESRPENDKDTRALESTYLARGQAERVVDLGQSVLRLSQMELRKFDPNMPIALTALITLEDSDENRAHYFLAPAGAGTKLNLDGLEIRVVTPQSPLGRALIGKCAGDDIDVPTPHGVRECSIIEVA
jgi:transcription elongation GreA/GreB family factor